MRHALPRQNTMRYFLFGVLIVFTTHMVVRGAQRMGPGDIRRGLDTAAQAASAVSPKIGRLLRALGLAHDLYRENRAARSPGGMGLADARQLLGVSVDATREEINSAYRQLMRANHPDQGGSEEAASRINAARDRLLKELDA